jgi:hypothetical protein
MILLYLLYTLYTQLMALKVTPRICVAPCTVYIALSVQRHPDNRWAVVEVDGPIYRSSRIQLDGDDASITQEPMRMKDLPEGVYDVKAILYQLRGEVERQTISVEVHGVGR